MSSLAVAAAASAREIGDTNLGAFACELDGNLLPDAACGTR